jgi:type II secretory pathway pseudopilin PulG
MALLMLSGKKAMRVQLNRKFNKGFTYIGLLLFIAITGLGLSVAGMSWQYQVRAEKEKQLLFVGSEFRDAINSYYATTPDAVKVYPQSLSELLLDKRTAYVKRHLRKIYVDPMTGKADWGFVSQQGGIVGIYSRSSLVPYKQKGFNVVDAKLAGAKSYRDWIFTGNPTDNIKSAEEVAKIKQAAAEFVNGSSVKTPSATGQTLEDVDKKNFPINSPNGCKGGDCLRYDPKYQ